MRRVGRKVGPEGGLEQRTEECKWRLENAFQDLHAQLPHKHDYAPSLHFGLIYSDL